jgi:hypothetical protein
MKVKTKLHVKQELKKPPDRARNSKEDTKRPSILEVTGDVRDEFPCWRIEVSYKKKPSKIHGLTKIQQSFSTNTRLKRGDIDI